MLGKQYKRAFCCGSCLCMHEVGSAQLWKPFAAQGAEGALVGCVVLYGMMLGHCK